MANEFISVAIPTDRASIADAIYERFAEQVPGWEFQPVHPMTYLVEAFSEWIAELLERATEVPAGILRQLGWLFRVLPRDATQATGTSTWTFTVDDEYLIEAGTPVSALNSAGERLTLLVRTSYLKAAGLFTTPAGAVELIAETAGAAGTGLQADARLDRPSITVDTITILAPTTGGVDGETDTEYLNRLSIYFGNRTEVLVRAINYETDAVVSVPQVSRALAIDNYDADTATAGVGGHITVAVIDENGADPGSTIRDAGELMQQDKSVAGLTVHWIAATYTTATIVFAGIADSNYAPAEVEARAEQAVLDYISPANHGLPTEGDQRRWIDRPIIRRQDIITVLNNVLGFDHYTSLTLNGSSSADITLTGPAGLPAPAPTSTVSGTVT
jgi:hypothetical protein